MSASLSLFFFCRSTTYYDRTTTCFVQDRVKSQDKLYHKLRHHLQFPFNYNFFPCSPLKIAAVQDVTEGILLCPLFL